MIKLVQGFDIGSPLPIDGRILLSKREMLGNYYEDPESLRRFNLDDILPNHYFAFCKDEGDNRLYLFNKENKIINASNKYGKFVLADDDLLNKLSATDKDLRALINSLKKDVNESLDELTTELNNEVDRAIAEEATIKTSLSDLTTKVDEYYDLLDSKIDNRVDALDDKIYEEEVRAKDVESSLNQKIDSNVKRLDDIVGQGFSDKSLTEKIVEVEDSLQDESLQRAEDISAVRNDLIDEAIERSHADDQLANRMEEYEDNLDAYIKSNNSRVDSCEERLDTVEASLEKDSEDIEDLQNNFESLSLKVDDNSNRLSVAEEDIVSLKEATQELSTLRPEFNEFVIESTDAFNEINDRLDTIDELSSDYNERITENEEAIDLLNNATIPNINNNIDSINNNINTLETNIEDVDSKVDAVNQAIDKDVVTNIEIKEAHPDYMLIGQKVVNILSGDDSKYLILDLPKADATKAGLMSSTDVTTLAALKSKINSIAGGTIRLLFKTNFKAENNTFIISYVDVEYDSSGEPMYEYNYSVNYTTSYTPGDLTSLRIEPSIESKQYGTIFEGSGVLEPDDSYKITIYEIGKFDDPTDYYFKLEDNNLVFTREQNKQNINSYVLDQGFIKPFSGVAVVIEDTGNIWRYYFTEESGEVIGWVDEGIDSVEAFSNETPGIIKGAIKDGFVYAESDGTGAVYGWNDLTTAVFNNGSEIISIKQTLNDKVDKEEGKSLINTSEINRLKGMATSAVNVSESTQNGYINITKVVNDSELTQDTPVYVHPNGSSPNTTLGLYKFSTDEHSHISEVSSIESNDIVGLLPGIISHTIRVSDWNTEGDIYKAQVQVSSVNEHINCIADLNMHDIWTQSSFDTYTKEWCKVFKAITVTNGIEFYALNAPSIDLPINIKIV